MRRSSLALVLLAACAEAPQGVVREEGCRSCHGSNKGAAPPFALDGAEETTARGVGAHEAHLFGSDVAGPVSCSECHLVPEDLNDPGHIDDDDQRAELLFGALADEEGKASYDGANLTCSNVYCHGASLAGGTDTEPVWNVVDGSQAACGACHGMPPPSPHPQGDNCELCHAPVAGPGQTIAIPARHVDGVEDVEGEFVCTNCHGSENAAPPKDLMGLDDSPQVGAHQAHLLGTGRSAPVPCVTCHLEVDPNNPDQPGHFDTPPPAEITFAGLAVQGGAAATYTELSCAGTYCHVDGTPRWDDPPLECTGCHAMPPEDDVHGGGTASLCERCHQAAGPDQTIADASLHVNGAVEADAACDACHGQNGDAAPPVDLDGLMESPVVGAHQAHLQATIGRAVPCDGCHQVPARFDDAGHADTPRPAELVWSGVATAKSANPSYADLACSNTYCHGLASVQWDDADGSESSCGACHGMPPQSPAHNGVSTPDTCNDCHEEVGGPNQTIVDASLHLDGVVQVSGGACDTCHGSPPTPQTESFPGSAGAHMTHAGRLGFECADCHGNNGSGPTHDEGEGTVLRENVQLVFAARSFAGGTTTGNGSQADYQTADMSCGVGCHNPVVGNPPETPNLANRIGWTDAAPGCLGCHDQMSAAPPKNHDLAGLGDAGCTTCHDQSVHTQGITRIADPDPSDAFVYSNGDVDGLCKTCHDSTDSFFGTAAVDVTPYWTVSSHGAEGMACGDCHTYHGSNGGPDMVDRASSSCMASGCHDDLTAEFNQVPGGPPSHHRIEGGPGISVGCIDCHNPHLSQAAPNSAVDPDDKWSIYPLPPEAIAQKVNRGDYRGFCLACHDGSPPAGVQGALNIQQALQGGSDPTGFRKENESLHRKEHDDYNCQTCHASHGSPGTPTNGGSNNRGNPINRGRLLRDFMIIYDDSQGRGYSAAQNNYREEEGCSTPTTPGGFGCHD